MNRRRLIMASRKSSLPSGYTLLEYIQSTGLQYIKLDLPITKDTVCRIKFVADEATGNSIMGCDSSTRFFNASGVAYLDWARGRGGGRINGGRIDNGVLYDIEFGDWYVKNLETGTNILESTPWGDSVTYNNNPISIMYTPYTNPNNKAKGKIYLAQIYENSNLVRNLLPCINDAGEVGMFDTITNTFYGNAGDGKFIYEADFSEYIPLDYIEFTGTQYINTGIKPNAKTVCRIKVNMTKINPDITVGNYKSESDSFRFFNANSQIYLDYGSGRNNNRIFGGSWPVGQIVNFEFGNRYVKDLDTDEILIFDTKVGSFNKSYDICIMDSGAKSTTNRGSGKVYYLQIYKDGTLVRNMLPYMHPSGMVGMYDTVSKVFYSNAGTGELIAGYKETV